MGSIQLKPDEHLDVILNNPSNIFSKEYVLSESTYPLLAAYYQWIRKINGIHSKLDVVIQNEQILSEFIYLCEHNLLFFLTVTGRFDVIKELFLPHKLTPRERYLIQLIQKEYAQARQRQEVTPLKINKQESKTEENLVLEDWKKYANGLSNMDFYYYYDQEIKRLSYEYNLKQIQLLSQAYNDRCARLHQALTIMKADNDISEEERLEAEILYEKYDNMRRSLPDYTNIETASLQEIEQHYRLIKQCYDESEEIPELFKKYKDRNNKFAALSQEEKEQSKSIKKQLDTNEKEYNKKRKELDFRIKNIHKATQNDIDKSLHHIIHFVDKCPKNNLNSEQKEILSATINQLKNYKEKFKRTEQFDKTQELLKECSEELKKIENILKPILPPQALKVFLKEIELFNEGIIDRRMTIPEEQLVIGSPPPIPVQQKPINPEHVNPSTPTSDAPVDIDEKIESQIKETTVVIEQALHNITLFKSELQIMREENELIVLTEKQQHSYKVEINKIHKVLQECKEDDSLNTDDLSQIEAAEQLVNRINTIGFERVNINQLKSLYNHVDSLSSNYEDLEKPKDKLEELMNFLTDNLQNNAQI